MRDCITGSSVRKVEGHCPSTCYLIDVLRSELYHHLAWWVAMPVYHTQVPGLSPSLMILSVWNVQPGCHILGQTNLFCSFSTQIGCLSNASC